MLALRIRKKKCVFLTSFDLVQFSVTLIDEINWLELPMQSQNKEWPCALRRRVIVIYDNFGLCKISLLQTTLYVNIWEEIIKLHVKIYNNTIIAHELLFSSIVNWWKIKWKNQKYKTKWLIYNNKIEKKNGEVSYTNAIYLRYWIYDL